MTPSFFFENYEYGPYVPYQPGEFDGDVAAYQLDRVNFESYEGIEETTVHVESQQGIEEMPVNALDNFGLSQEEVESNHGNEDSLNEMAHDVASRVLQSAVGELREAAPRVRHAFRHWRQTTHQPQGVALLFVVT